jgi:hypothetical protein
MYLNFKQSLVLVLLLTAGLLGMIGGAFDSATLVPRLAVDVRHPVSGAAVIDSDGVIRENGPEAGITDQDDLFLIRTEDSDDDTASLGQLYAAFLQTVGDNNLVLNALSEREQGSETMNPIVATAFGDYLNSLNKRVETGETITISTSLGDIRLCPLPIPVADCIRFPTYPPFGPPPSPPLTLLPSELTCRELKKTETTSEKKISDNCTRIDKKVTWTERCWSSYVSGFEQENTRILSDDSPPGCDGGLKDEFTASVYDIDENTFERTEYVGKGFYRSLIF